MNRRAFLLGSAALVGVASVPAAVAAIPAPGEMTAADMVAVLMSRYAKLRAEMACDLLVYGSAVLRVDADGLHRVPFSVWADRPVPIPSDWRVVTMPERS